MYIGRKEAFLARQEQRQHKFSLSHSLSLSNYTLCKVAICICLHVFERDRDFVLVSLLIKLETTNENRCLNESHSFIGTGKVSLQYIYSIFNVHTYARMEEHWQSVVGCIHTDTQQHWQNASSMAKIVRIHRAFVSTALAIVIINIKAIVFIPWRCIGVQYAACQLSCADCCCAQI